MQSNHRGLGWVRQCASSLGANSARSSDASSVPCNWGSIKLSSVLCWQHNCVWGKASGSLFWKKENMRRCSRQEDRQSLAWIEESCCSCCLGSISDALALRVVCVFRRRRRIWDKGATFRRFRLRCCCWLCLPLPSSLAPPTTTALWQLSFVCITLPLYSSLYIIHERKTQNATPPINHSQNFFSFKNCALRLMTN